MRFTTLLLVSIVATVGANSLAAQARPLSVCEALNMAADHQSVTIRARIGSTRHEKYLFEGTGQDPCPGWRKRFFTAPAAIPLILGSYSNISVSDSVSRENLSFVERLSEALKSGVMAPRIVTLSGILIRKRWPLIFRSSDGSYCCWGEGIDGGSAAIVVVTTSITENSGMDAK